LCRNKYAKSYRHFGSNLKTIKVVEEEEESKGKEERKKERKKWSIYRTPEITFLVFLWYSKENILKGKQV
jgi:hypothetical protein